MKKYVIFAICAFCFFSFNAKAISYTIGDDTGFYTKQNLPYYFDATPGNSKSFNFGFATIYDDSFNILVIDVCSTLQYSLEITGSCNDSCFSKNNVLSFNTGKKCPVGGYNATLYRYQVQVSKVYQNDSYGMNEVASQFKFTNKQSYWGPAEIQGAVLSNEDILTPLINAQKQQNSLDSINKNQQQTNEKLDKVNEGISSESPDTSSSKCGIICKLKGIFTGIVELPGKLISGLLEGIKNLFVPTDDQLYEIINDSKELTENFGFIGEAMSFFINIFTSLLGLVNANGCLELPEFTIGETSLTPRMTFWKAQNVCLADNVILSSNIETIRAFTDVVLVGLFVSFAARKFFGVLSKDTAENDNTDKNSNTNWV